MLCPVQALGRRRSDDLETDLTVRDTREIPLCWDCGRNAISRELVIHLPLLQPDEALRERCRVCTLAGHLLRCVPSASTLRNLFNNTASPSSIATQANIFCALEPLSTDAHCNPGS
jgi:hypothetical protein